MTVLKTERLKSVRSIDVVPTGTKDLATNRSGVAGLPQMSILGQ